MENIPINISNRHIHLSQKDLNVLFGNKYELKVKKMLMQPGQFAAEEQVTILGPKGEINYVRVVGPVRSETQCEILSGDQIKLGIKDVPVRESGNIENSPGFKIKSPTGEIVKDKGLIIAKRHVHLTPQTASKLNLVGGEVVSVETNAAKNIDNLIIRISENYVDECHIDKEESVSMGMENEEIVKINLV